MSLFVHAIHAHNSAERIVPPNEVVVFDIKPNPNFIDHVVVPKAFTSEECDKMIQYGLLQHKQDASVSETPHANSVIRKSRVAWISYNPETAWIFEKLRKYAHKINKKHYGFQLSGFFEPLQFTEYTAPDSHYTWHIDMGEGELSLRKLSLVIQLSDPSEYEGGNLEIFADPIKIIPKGKGNLGAFPAYIHHRVTPVTKGKRYSLVVWVSGQPYK